MINRSSALTSLAYIIVAGVSISLGVLVASSLMTKSYSQPSPEQAPPDPQPGGPGGEQPPPDPQPGGGGQEGGEPQPLEGGASVAEKISAEFQSFLEPYIYDPKGRRDPFKPYVEIQPVEEGDLQGPLLPLQRFDLNQIQLIGIIWGVRNPKAMFLDPNNQIHIIGKDERIGRNNGYVAVIREGEVVIVEATRKNEETIYTTTVMKIQR